MAFATGLLLIDAPASALNNLGGIEGVRDENTVGVKLIRTPEGAYPYVSAQAFRYWLRSTLESKQPDWRAAPIFRETKVAYTDGNPIEYWDDDLFGYMRAQSTRAAAQRGREQDASRAIETPLENKVTITRISPFRVSTLVSIAPVRIVEDFGVMARHEGDPVPHVHQFYRTTLQGLFSLDLSACGTFSAVQRTGYLNLDKNRIELARERGLEPLNDGKAYRLPLDERIKRISTLFEGLAALEGGAKLTLHYTDVTPVVVLLAVTKGGNHIFAHVIQADAKGKPTVNEAALGEALTIYKEEILSPVYIGWVKGFADAERAKLEGKEQELGNGKKIIIDHPRQVFCQFIKELKKNPQWLE